MTEGNVEQVKIIGHRELSDVEKAFINAVKAKGNEIGKLIEEIMEEDMKEANYDAEAGRCRDLAKEHIQTGMMWLVRSIAKPENFC